MFVDLGSVYMMNQPIELAVAGFLPTAREDLDEEEQDDSLELDTCRVYDEVAPTPTCQSDVDIGFQGLHRIEVIQTTAVNVIKVE